MQTRDVSITYIYYTITNILTVFGFKSSHIIEFWRRAERD
jgi:hAT family C-terminal dimerisation region